MSPGYTNGLGRNGAHVFQLCSEQVFQLSFPRDQVLHQAFPAALVKGQLPG
ncbi:hypothetical protein ABZX95_49145 [Streptomyces sp. NPDC004232]|uniref:hypothetical protein n=1 Tax=Streptomyces sp. NPDC004232 TaxID=3154454 RepID=UPI001DDA7B5B|nr:hypothetical protein [Streptomyces sp. tea 10]